MSIGIDIEVVKRFDLPKTNPLIKKIFTKKEIDYAFSKKDPKIHLCGIFCAKEAIRKAGKKDLLMREIEISHEKDGKPKANLPFDISISHAGEYAIAIARKK